LRRPIASYATISELTVLTRASAASAGIAIATGTRASNTAVPMARRRKTRPIVRKRNAALRELGQGVRVAPGAAMSREAIAAMPRLKELTFILDEMRRNLVEHRITAEQADRIEQAMRQAFEEAEVDRDEIERLEPAMTNDPKDRHVLAAAVASDSELIVTFDLHDFPVAACEPVGVEATHPDDFLLDLHDLDPEAVRGRTRATGRRPQPTLATRRAPARTHQSRCAALRRHRPHPALTSLAQCATRLTGRQTGEWPPVRRSPVATVDARHGRRWG
jgi:predicted nucleic acid-binding protein